MKHDQQKSNLDNTEPSQIQRIMNRKFSPCWPILLTVGVCGTLTTDHAGFMVRNPDAGTPASACQELFIAGCDVTSDLRWPGDGCIFEFAFPRLTSFALQLRRRPHLRQPGAPPRDYPRLGALPGGQQLEFGIQVKHYGYGISDWSGGPVSRNANNPWHAYLVSDNPTTGSTYVGFEDIQHGYCRELDRFPATLIV